MENNKKSMSIRTSLIISISLVHAVLMGLFVYHSTGENKTFIRDEIKSTAVSFARMLATTSTNAILSRDLASLHEYVDKTGVEHNVSYALIEDGDGKVLASTGQKFDGIILTDQISKKAKSSQDEILQLAGNVIDVAVPIFIEGRKIGLARVGMSTETMIHKLADIRNDGIKMTLFAILVGSFVAVIIAMKVTNGLRRLGSAADEMSGGNLEARADVDSYREINDLAHAFNNMSYKIQEREEELQSSMEELDHAHEELQSANEQLQQNFEELEHTNEELQSTTEELQSSNEELSRANERVTDSDRLKSQFLANMSHELRTPLNSVIALSGILLARMDGDLTEEQEKQVGIIERSGKNLLELINDILDLSKIESGKIEIYMEDFRIEDVVNDAWTTVHPLASEKGLNITFTTDGSMQMVRSDKNKVKQILLNLLSNAVKFTPKGGSIAVNGIDRYGHIDIQVADTGIGIAKDNLEKIFDEFHQVDGSNTREYGGTGLGLAITKRLVRLLEGEITVESEPGKGSTFTVSIPKAVEEAAALDTVNTFVGIDPDKKTVLVVEDDISALYIIKKYLESDGYQVVSARTGEEAIRLAREIKPSAITLDIMIPGRDGWEVIKELKDDTSTEHIPIVVISILDNKALGFSLGATEYLTKPAKRDVMLGTIKRVLSNKCSGMECIPQLLLVDDDPIHIMAMKAVLTDNGYGVSVAPGGNEAIEILKDMTPCAIILDIMMPDVDGFMVIEELKKKRDTRDIPVIILTAKDITAEERKRLSGSIQVIIEKGIFASDEVLKDLKYIVRGRELHSE